MHKTLIILITVVPLLIVLFLLGFYLLFRKWYNKRHNYDRLPLHTYLDTVGGQPVAKTLPELRKEAEQLARFYLRSSVEHAYFKALFTMGSREEKFYFQLRNLATREKDTIMYLLKKGDLNQLHFSSDSQRKNLSALLGSIRHPLLMPIQFSDFLVDKQMAIVFRQCVNSGTLKDHIYRVKPLNPYNKKYRRKGKPLAERLIASYGRQMLEALSLLRKHRIPYLQLHSGNVFVSDDGRFCCLSDYENGIFGVTPHYQKFIRHYKDIIDPDVVCLAFVLFEMGAGFELKNANLEEFPPRFSASLKEVLQEIFRSNEKLLRREQITQADYVSLEAVMANPFFSNVVLPPQLLDDSQLQLEGTNLLRQYWDPQPETNELSKSGQDLESQPQKKKRRSTTKSSITTTTTSSKPPPAPKAPPPPPAAPAPAAKQNPGGRKNLLSSIESFSHRALKKTETNDRSAPKV